MFQGYKAVVGTDLQQVRAFPIAKFFLKVEPKPFFLMLGTVLHHSATGATWNVPRNIFPLTFLRNTFMLFLFKK